MWGGRGSSGEAGSDFRPPPDVSRRTYHRRRGAANKAPGTPLSQAMASNDLWCADFKGEFKTGDGRYCYPLTVTDQASRMILLCEALESTKELPVIEALSLIHI